MSDGGLACAFVAGLPDAIRLSLRAGSRLEKMNLSELLTRARAVMVEEDVSIAVAAVAEGRPARTSNLADPPVAAGVGYATRVGSPTASLLTAWEDAERAEMV